MIIDKALKEENPEKKQGFANAVAYYMKLAYSNWHKETVHDDAIQSELSNITDGQLAFTNTPYVRSPRQNEGVGGNERRNFNDFRNKRNQKFQSRGRNEGNRNNGGGKFNKKRYK